MKFSVSISIILIIANSTAFAKINLPANLPTIAPKNSSLSENALIEELTGKKNVNTQTAADLKKAPLPVQHYYAGQHAMTQKNYILAIKHFNTVIQKYPQSNQVPLALSAKARVYKEMGLQPQAERNLKLAQLKKQSRSAAGVAALQSKGKLNR